MNVDITLLSSVTEEIADGLRKERLHQAAALVEATSTMTKCQALAERTGIDAHTLYRLGRQAELTLIHGIGVVYTELLEYFGVSSMQDLAASCATTLHARMHDTKNIRITWRLPSQQEVERWIAQAQKW